MSQKQRGHLKGDPVAIQCKNVSKDQILVHLAEMVVDVYSTGWINFVD